MHRLLGRNPQLQEFSRDVDYRMQLYRDTKARLLPEGDTLNDFANAHDYFGIHHIERGWVYREWAPNAHQLYLAGEFNGWNGAEQPLMPLGNGCWVLYLPGDHALWEGCRIKTIVDANQERTAHIPIYARRVVQEPHSNTWCAEVVDDKMPFHWTDQGFRGEKSLKICEAHVGMTQEPGRAGTYREFADHTLPRIKEGGYNTVQLIATIGSPCNNSFGKPEDLKYLVNKAHEMGIRVLMDVVHSYGVKNNAEGINLFEGTAYPFFHPGGKGDLGTGCFDYGKTEVIHFLLSNLKFWMTEYHLDGFRFIGITSMLYHDHGQGTDFNPDDTYFPCNTHLEAITYLQLANELIRQVNPNAITIAQDMSGMPGMCLPVADGGIGFDLCQGMGPADSGKNR